MRSQWYCCLIIVSTLCPQVSGQDPKKAKADDQPRFSEEMIALFRELSEPYEINRKTVPPGMFDDKILAKLAKSPDRDVSTLASMAREIKFLHLLQKEQGKKARIEIEEQAKKIPAIIAGRLIEGLRDSDSDISTIRGAAKAVEDMMGSEPQQAVNNAWAIGCLGNGLAIKTREKLRTIATREKAPMSAPKNSIIAALETRRDRLGTVTLLNRTSRSLHHCLITGRLQADRERLQAIANQERLVGVFIMPSLGFSKQTVEGSLLATQLRTSFNQQDKGMMIYVSEIPPRTTVSAFLERADYFLISKSADVSLWSDELMVEHQGVSNFQQAQSAVQLAMRMANPRLRR